MLKKLFLVSGLLLLIANGLQAQRWSFAGGFVYEFIGLKERDPLVGTPTPYTLGPFYGLSLNGSYVLAHKNDVVSACLDPGVRLGFNYFSYGGQASAWFLGQVPLTLMGRVGAGATPFNEQKVGFGLGFGANMTYLYSTQLYPPLHKLFVNPNAVAELNINGRSTIYHIRFHMTPVGAPADLNGLPVTFSNFGLEIVTDF
ncbi:MAG: hypothetical protein H6581_27310 [Bacteroidia bacterium]|nr:hypothetical protein [Bacteroidia bacterium]